LLRLPAVGDNASVQTEPSKADSPKRKRRWFQFSLRTLMIAVTVLAVACGYVGWQVKIVRARKAFQERLELQGGWVYIGSDSGRFAWHPAPIGSLELPWIRQRLGDEAAIVVYVPTGDEYNEDYAEASRLFPEASVERAGKLPRIERIPLDAEDVLTNWLKSSGASTSPSPP
jgi:hypothetical protein